MEFIKSYYRKKEVNKMRKSLMAKFLILCILLIVGAVFHILNVPELIEEFVKFIAVIVVLIMIKQVFDYLNGKRE